MRAFGWLLFAVFGALIASNMLAYFTGTPDFLLERPELTADPAWRSALYVHVTGGLFCLVTSVAAAVRRPWSIHRHLGRAYACSVLGLLCPTGFYLALFAKGGTLGRAAFFAVFTCAAWTTARGVWAILSRRIAEHREWMIRSFAVIATAITFRAIHVAFHLTDVDPLRGYVAANWLSLALNVVVAELIIHRSRRNSHEVVVATVGRVPVRSLDFGLLRARRR